MKKTELLKLVKMSKCRGAWNKGVKKYAVELVQEVEPRTELNRKNLQKILLNGACGWGDFSWGGCSLIYNDDIAKRLCTKSEYKKVATSNSLPKKPNPREEWLDVQARALSQAYYLIYFLV